MGPEKLLEVLRAYAATQGMELNGDTEFVLDIMAGLLKNEERYGYRCCPCRLAAGNRGKDADIICPCRYRDDDIREFGSCYCSLYVSRQWNEGVIPRRKVPERRNVVR